MGRFRTNDAFINSRGMSLPSVMIAAAVGVIVMVALTQMTSSQFKTIARAEDYVSMNSLRQIIEYRLRDNTACTNSLNGVLVSTTPQPFIVRSATNAPVYNPSNPNLNKYDMINIDSIVIRDESVGGPNSRGLAFIEVTMSRQRGGGTGQGRVISIPVYLETNAAGTVNNCVNPGIDILEVVQPIAGSGSNGVMTSYNTTCPPDRTPVSCGFIKNSNVEEDEMVCRLNIPANGCHFRVDQDYAFDGATGYCYCIK